MKKIILGILAIALFSGCARVHSQVTVFHELPKIDGTKKIYYTFYDNPELTKSIEYKTYKAKIKTHLASKNFVETKNARLRVFFVYGIDNGKTVTRSRAVFGQTGVSSSTTTGTIRGNTVSGTTTYKPTYGVVGHKQVSDTEYTRYLKLVIYDLKNKSSLYEGKVVSEGSSSELVAVMDAMIESLFDDFPGKSGTTKTVRKKYIK